MSTPHPPERSGGSLKVIPRRDPAGVKNQRGIVVMVCGGGGAKAAAHVGALRALEEADLFPGHFLGTSMGGVFGALFASGLSAREALDRVGAIGEREIVQT